MGVVSVHYGNPMKKWEDGAINMTKMYTDFIQNFKLTAVMSGL